ncbi:general transcription factor II-I repeat domain-containing 2-like protein [Trichonephila clavata]|uniref:General transcription factor II-I repeat domain-containing 2-like protein n=1 Tax=Trichonephila clavata TaxID=2740835 RepID=A0A8X6KCX3_TRICU|nr:general transcription factor II-I repeat domain-containing 2-like protein [Trichonephila clavata]
MKSEQREEWEKAMSSEIETMHNGSMAFRKTTRSVSITKKSNIERHFKTVHTNFDSDYPMNSEIRRKKIIPLKSSITNQQSFFTKPLQQHKAARIASYKISHLLAKNKKPFTDGELVKEATLEAVDSLFEEFKNKKEIVSAINTLQLSA